MPEPQDELQVLRDLRDLLEPPKNWVKGHFATDDAGLAVFEHSSQAACWCLWGGINRIVPPLTYENTIIFRRLDRLVRDRGFSSIPDFNDSSTHREILELLDEAIADVIAERTANAKDGT